MKYSENEAVPVSLLSSLRQWSLSKRVYEDLVTTTRFQPLE